MSDRLNEILEAYRFWDDFVKRKKREIKRLREQETSTAVRYSEAPGGSGGHSLADYAEKLDELEGDLRELRHKREEAYDDIFRLLVRMKSSAQIDVIYRRYILLQSWPQICAGRDISKRTAMDCHDRALIILDQILDLT